VGALAFGSLALEASLPCRLDTFMWNHCGILNMESCSYKYTLLKIRVHVVKRVWFLC